MDRSYFPSIISFTPTLATTGVTTLPDLVAKFNMEVEATQFTDHLSEVVLLVSESSQEAIPLTYVSYLNKALTVQPASALTPGEAYQVTLSRNIVSVDGRGMGANRLYVFTVNSYDIPQVDLLTPADSTAVSDLTFTWSGVTWSGTGSIQYHVQLDVNTSFTTVATQGWETTTPLLTATVGTVLTTRIPYFWRVRAEEVSGTTVGPWSEARPLYYGSFLNASADSRQTYEQTEITRVDTSGLPDPDGPEGYLSNQSAYPSLSFTFTRDLASATVTPSTVTLTRHYVDGYPDAVRRAVPFTLTVSGADVTVTPQQPIVGNCKYTLTFSKTIEDILGAPLVKDIVYYWTSGYRPFYCQPDVIRADFGYLLIDVPDDLINFHIFRTSLDVNRDFLFYASRWMGGPSQALVRELTLPATIPTYAMEKYVEFKASERLLTAVLMGVLKDAGRMQRLADYSEQTNEGIVKEFRELIKTKSQEAAMWHSQWSRHWAHPVAGGFGTTSQPVFDSKMSRFRRDI
jgi:hypothetical protein